jgi:CubicO group peptidase (beta-lactamase class C family)
VSKKQKTHIELIDFSEFKLPSGDFVRNYRKKSNWFFNERFDPKRFHGMFLVAKNGKIIYERTTGYVDFGRVKMMQVDQPIHVASVSKVATSLGVLRLVDQGKISLDAPVKTYLPSFPYPEITVKMLLNHRSGLQYYGYFYAGKWSEHKVMTNRDVLNLLAKYKFPLNFPANSKFAYCNTNFALLALIVEEVTDKRFADVMDSLVFQPLNMKNSFFADERIPFDKLPASYNSRLIKQPFTFLDAICGDKNLYTTARDLMRMDLGTYSNKFLSDSLRQKMYQGYSYERRGKANYGLGIRMKEEKGKETYFFHTGWWHGNTSSYGSLRNDTVCVVALSNVYDRSVYRISRFSTVFGDYPFAVLEE